MHTTEEKTERAINRNFFLAGPLHQRTAYDRAARLLRARLLAEPGSDWVCGISHTLRDEPAANATNYFRLGQAEYGLQQYPAAFQHWRQAMAARLASFRAHQYVLHFDSLLARWPTQPQLLLGRALARLSNDTQWSVAQQAAAWQAALRDLDLAEQQGLTGFEINFYRALALDRLDRWAEARQQLNEAIRKNPAS